jgi:hypothetical protein
LRILDFSARGISDGDACAVNSLDLTEVDDYRLRLAGDFCGGPEVLGRRETRHEDENQREAYFTMGNVGLWLKDEHLLQDRLLNPLN